MPIKSLKTALQEARRDKVVDDVVALIDSEVQSKSGLSGLAIKGGYKAVKALKNGKMIRLAADGLLDAFTDAIEPLHQRFRDEGGDSFVPFLERNATEATNALLAITDKRAERSDHRILKSTYLKLRPQGEVHVKQALPGVGRLADKYTAG